MKNIISFLFLWLSSASLYSHTIEFGSSVDQNGVLKGGSNSFVLMQGGALTCLIKNSVAFNQTRLMLKIYEINKTGGEVKQDSVYVDVYKSWVWTTTAVIFKSDTANSSFRVALFNSSGEELCSSKIGITFTPSNQPFVDPDKLAAYEGIWGAMMAATKKVDISALSGKGQKGGASGGRFEFSLTESKEIQITAYPFGSFAFTAGKISFNYTLSTNTSGKPDVIYTTTTKPTDLSVTHNVKLEIGSWSVRIVDEQNQELGHCDFVITK